MTVTAANLDEAVEKAHRECRLPADAEYLADSFEVDREEAEQRSQSVSVKVT